MKKKILVYSGVGLGLITLKLITNGRHNIYYPDLTEKVVIVTGGSDGLGRETCKVLAHLGATVIFTGRDIKKAQKWMDEFKTYQNHLNNDIPHLEFKRIDYEDLKEVANFAEDFLEKHTYLHALVNNAGTTEHEYGKTKQGIEKTIQVNFLAPAYLTSLLMPAIKRTSHSRIINVGSEPHRWITDPGFDDFFHEKMNKDNFHPWKTYGYSKLNLIMWTKGLANYIEENKIDAKVVSLHPGSIRTNIARNAKLWWKTVGVLAYPLGFFVSKGPGQGCQTHLTTILMPYDQLVNGGYYSDCQLSKASEIATDEQNVQKAWKMTIDKLKELTGEKKIFGQ